jgi:DNA-binding CsgD family transcriptional regulator/tetratricopeptide (TPR) repeat protein
MLDGERVSSAFATFLHQRTGGVPLAVEESVRLLGDRADLVRVERVGEAGGEWVRRSLADLQVSPTIRDSVLERVQRLCRPAQDLLQAASVLAEPTPAAVATEVAGLTEQAAIIEAVGSGLLREDDRGRLAFRHAFMGQAVYEAIPGGERRRLHLLAGRALERVEPPPVVQLTRHFREANEVGKWCRYAEQAAARAVASGDRTTATALLNELLRGADLPGATRARLARELAANALVRRESVDELHRRVVGTLQMVLETGLSAAEEADIRSRLGRLLAQQGDLGAAQSELERAIDHLNHDSAEAARAMTYLGWPHLGPWPASVHLQWLQRAAETDHSKLSLVDRYALTADRATALLQLGEEAGWDVAAELPDDATGAEVRRLLARSNLNIGYAAVLWGRYEEAARRFGVAMALADDVHYPRLVSKVMVARADLTWFTGRWDSLERQAAELLGAEDVDPLVYLSATRLAGWLHAAQGARRKAEDCFQAALDGFRELGAAEDVIEPAAALGRLWLADGRAGDALTVTDEPIQPVTGKEIWVWATDIAPVRVEALLAAGRREEAVELVSAYAQGLSGRAAPAAQAGLVTCQALVAGAQGRDPVAEFARAAAAWDRLPRPYDALRARGRQAGALFATGSAEEGLALLAEVWQGLSDLGARGDADRVARQLRERGVEVRRPWRGGRRGYGSAPSPRELEVIRLVLAGKTNREIADALCKSPRTVAGQLGSVMRKLGVSSRTELAVRVVEAGLLPDEA